MTSIPTSRFLDIDYTDCYNCFQSKEAIVFYFHRFYYKSAAFKKFDSIIIMVDQLIEITRFVLCNKRIINEEIIKFFVDNVYKHHGFAKDINSNCTTQFIFKFWQFLIKVL